MQSSVRLKFSKIPSSYNNNFVDNPTQNRQSSDYNKNNNWNKSTSLYFDILDKVFIIFNSIKFRTPWSRLQSNWKSKKFF